MPSSHISDRRQPMTVVERLMALLRIQSVTGGGEGPLCDFLVSRFDGDDSPVSRTYALTRVGDSFALYPRVRRHEALLTFVGHLDTVAPAANTPNPPRIAEDRIYGLGAADMKSGVAVMWGLVEQPEAHPAYDLAFLFYAGEEGPYLSSGLGPLLSSLTWLGQVTLAVCLEPSDNVLQLGCLGTLHATVSYQGQAAHSARPWQGRNAVHAAGPLLAMLAELKPVERQISGLRYREVISATLAQGGRARNVVPDSFTLNLNFRFAPDRSVASAKRHVIEVVASSDIEGTRGSVEFLDIAPSGAIPAQNMILERWRDSKAVAVGAKQAWTDVGRLSSLGIDAVNFGPGEGEEAHKANESTSIALLQAGDAHLRQFIRR